MQNENLLIEPQRKRSRKDFFIATLVVLLFWASIELLYPILKPNRSHSIPFTNGFFFVISAVYVTFALSRKIYQKIQIDYENNKLIIGYITLFKNNCETIIPFEELEYGYEKIATKNGEKWTLQIWKKDKKVFSLEEGAYGFHKEKIDLLVEKFEEIEQ